MFALIPTLEWRFGLKIHVMTVMPNHFHIVVEGSVAALSRAMGWLNWVYARTFNEKYGLYGHVFAERFGARVIDNEPYFTKVCDYVLANPVKAGLCERIEDWPWSRHRRHAPGRATTPHRPRRPPHTKHAPSPRTRTRDPSRRCRSPRSAQGTAARATTQAPRGPARHRPASRSTRHARGSPRHTQAPRPTRTSTRVPCAASGRRPRGTRSTSRRR